MKSAEVEIMRRLQRAAGVGDLPRLARGYSWWGEHARGWLALAALGALLDRRHRAFWLEVGGSAFAAHAAAVVIKRVVRRPRPDDPSVRVLVATPSDLSFPSAHAASTTAAAVALTPLVGGPVAAVATAAMAISRVLLGVHYPSDVAAGAVIGAVAARSVRAARR